MPIIRRTQAAPIVVNYLYLASDTVLTDRYGTVVDVEDFVATLEANILRVQQWYWDTLDGWTFDTIPIQVFRDSRTEAELLAIYDGENNAIWRETLGAANTAGRIYRDSPLRLHYLLIPLWNTQGGSFPASVVGFGAPFDYPGTSCTQSYVCRALGGIYPQFIAYSTLTNSPGSGGTALNVQAGDGVKFALGAERSDYSVAAPPSPATSGVSLVVGAGQGASFPATPFDAVVWQWGTGHPTIPTAEAVQVTAKATDTFTIVRARNGTTARAITATDRIKVRKTTAVVWAAGSEPEDAGFELVTITAYSANSVTVTRGVSGTTPRNLVAGDNIAILDHENTLSQDLCAGSYAHELGHVLGDLSHTPSGIMSGSYASFPAVGWDSDAEETTVKTLTRVLYPHGERPGVSTPGVNPYKVQPLVWWASDTASDVAFFQTPMDPAQFRANVDANVLYVRRWFWDNFDGYTFDALPAVTYTAPMTGGQTLASYPESDIYYKGVYDADMALPEIDVTNTQRLHVFMTPYSNCQQSAYFGPSSAGHADHFTSFYPYNSNDFVPLVCGIWAPLTGLNIGVEVAAGPGVGTQGSRDYSDGRGPWTIWQGPPDYACSTFAHELGHAFGYQPPTYPAMYVHDDSFVTAENKYNLMHSFAHHLQLCAPTANQKTVFKTSPFMSHYAVRP